MQATVTPRRRRVPALPPEGRRAALIAATLPLLREHGMAVSTRQIADAAGVAEGTIFGVFPDKASLIRAAIKVAFDPAPTLRALGSIAPDLPLRPRLEAAVWAIGVRVAANAPLLAVARGALRPDELATAREQVLAAVAGLIAPDAARLRHPPAAVAQFLLSLIFTSAHGIFGRSELEPPELVALLLDGLLVRQDTPPQESVRAG